MGQLPTAAAPRGDSGIRVPCKHWLFRPLEPPQSPLLPFRIQMSSPAEREIMTHCTRVQKPQACIGCTSGPATFHEPQLVSQPHLCCQWGERHRGAPAHSFPVVAVTNYYQPSGLKQHAFIISQARSLIWVSLG